MAVKIMGYVWDIPNIKGSDKLIMLCLADFANDDGFCWPSIETIARKSGVSSSTVKSSINKLTKANWLTKKNQFKKGANGKVVRSSNAYCLDIVKLRAESDKATLLVQTTQSQQPDSERSNLEHSKSEQTKFERSNLEQTESNRGVGQISTGGRPEVDHKPSLDPLIDPPSKDLAPSKLEPEVPPLFELPTNRNGETYPVTYDQTQEWAETFPAVDIRAQIKRMIAWLDANPRNRKTKQGMAAFINRWLSKEQDKGRYLPPEQVKQHRSEEESQALELKKKIKQIELDIDGENQQLLRYMDWGGTDAAKTVCKNKISKLSKQRQELLRQLDAA